MSGQDEDREWERTIAINARRGHDLNRPSDPERVRRHLDGAPDMRDGKPRCPVCGVTGYQKAMRVTPDSEVVFWCRKGHPHYVQSFNPNVGRFFERAPDWVKTSYRKD